VFRAQHGLIPYIKRIA